jgi:hypothetical protein
MTMPQQSKLHATLQQTRAPDALSGRSAAFYPPVLLRILRDECSRHRKAKIKPNDTTIRWNESEHASIEYVIN